MKKIFLLLFSAVWGLAALAQPCVPDLALDTPGISPSETPGIPCIVQGEPYDFTVQFKNFDTFDFGGPVTVDFMELDTIDNMPCGISWNANKAYDFAAGHGPRYAHLENGCIRLTGTTSDAVGQYKLRFIVRADIIADGNADDFLPFYINAADYGLTLSLRVVASASDPCDPIDTTATYETASCPTKNNTAIAEYMNQVKSLEINPAVVHTDAQVQFISSASATYQLRVLDLLGNEMRSEAVQVHTGENMYLLNRDDLQPGIYLLSIGNGNENRVKRFVIP